MGLVDLETAFDSIEHDAMREVLADQGVDADYFDLLQIMYSSQTSSVVARTKRRSFIVERGVKHGEPISALLFIAGMDAIFQKLKKKWDSLNVRRNGQFYGMVVDDPDDPLTNLRFADDVLLIAGSKSDITKMIKDLKTEARYYGLTLHVGKTNVLTDCLVNRPTSLDCDGQSVKVLDTGSAERYLGRQLAVKNCHQTELANRIGVGWKAFFKFKATLCNRT
jgi:hypothetical protein